jgi:hypothetical protein
MIFKGNKYAVATLNFVDGVSRLNPALPTFCFTIKMVPFMG